MKNIGQSNGFFLKSKLNIIYLHIIKFNGIDGVAFFVVVVLKGLFSIKFDL